jgi:cysteine desulfurase family protein (TIGR01976 family)
MVVDAMTDYLFNHNANSHWSFATSRETDEIIENSRRAFADFLNCSPAEVAFGQNMTSLTFHLARALGRDFRAGDEIIVTELDHHANIDTWKSLEKERGVIFRVLPFDPESFTLDLDRLGDLLNEKTRLVAVGAASNAVGTISDVARVCAAARENGSLSFVDAVHFAAHELIDVAAIGCDFLACSAYKFYGPHIGILYGRRELLEATDFPKLRPAPATSPDRVETGTQSHESIAGAAAAVEFLASLAAADSRRTRIAASIAGLHERKAVLFRQLWDGLASLPKVRIYGPAPDGRRTPTIAFTVAGSSSRDVTAKLSDRGVFTSHGDFYASTVVQRIGLGEDGLVRAGLACYTDENDIDRLIEGVRSI